MTVDLAQYDFQNLVDDGVRFVLDELNKQLEVYPKEICLCNDCVVDMAAMALNGLPPKYRCSLLGSIYNAEDVNDSDYKTKLQKVVRTAIERVGSNPGHD